MTRSAQTFFIHSHRFQILLRDPKTFPRFVMVTKSSPLAHLSTAVKVSHMVEFLTLSQRICSATLDPELNFCHLYQPHVTVRPYLRNVSPLVLLVVLIRYPVIPVANLHFKKCLEIPGNVYRTLLAPWVTCKIR